LLSWNFGVFALVFMRRLCRDDGFLFFVFIILLLSLFFIFYFFNGLEVHSQASHCAANSASVVKFLWQISPLNGRTLDRHQV
jgi:hypothetical protein